MRALTLFTVTLALVLGLATGAQAALSVTMSVGSSTAAVSDIITITVVGDSDAEKALYVFGTIVYSDNVTPLGGQTQSKMLFGGSNQFTWLAGVLFVDNPNVGTQDAFNQITGVIGTKKMNNQLTTVMTFHADSSGTAVFSWLTTGQEHLHFFGMTNAEGVSVTIVPEPTTAGLMGLGLIGLVVAGRRRKS